MSATLKNILIFGGLGVILILVYVFLIRKAPEQASLVSATNPTAPISVNAGANNSIAQDFLSILLNVKSIKLDDAIFSDPAFSALFDSSILLIPDGTEGRPNPFAPIGIDMTAFPSSVTPASVPAAPTDSTPTPPTSTNKTAPPSL